MRPLKASVSEFSEHFTLLCDMEGACLPEELDQDARDLHRLIMDHGRDYSNTLHGDMTLPLVRSLHRLVMAAKDGVNL